MSIIKKNLIIAITFLIVFLGIIGFFVSKKSVSNLPVAQGVPTETEMETISPEVETKLQEQIAEIIKTKDFERCKEVNNEMYRTVCINNIALNLASETQDISYCQKIDNKLVPIETCESQIILKKSLEKEDINVCLETTNQDLQKRCQDSFWVSLAQKKEDVSVCENIKEDATKNYCHDSYLFDNEYTQNDPVLFSCDKFNDEQTKADCLLRRDILNNKTTFKSCDDFKSSLFLNYCMTRSSRVMNNKL
jgi:hypothetical protein